MLMAGSTATTSGKVEVAVVEWGKFVHLLVAVYLLLLTDTQYTRYRQWTRVAVVCEIVEVVDNGEVGMEREAPLSRESTVARPEDSPLIPTNTDRSSFESQSESPLRQRLRMALTKGSQP